MSGHFFFQNVPKCLKKTLNMFLQQKQKCHFSNFSSIWGIQSFLLFRRFYKDMEKNVKIIYFVDLSRWQGVGPSSNPWCTDYKGFWGENIKTRFVSLLSLHFHISTFCTFQFILSIEKHLKKIKSIFYFRPLPFFFYNNRKRKCQSWTFNFCTLI